MKLKKKHKFFDDESLTCHFNKKIDKLTNLGAEKFLIKPLGFWTVKMGKREFCSKFDTTIQFVQKR